MGAAARTAPSVVISNKRPAGCNLISGVSRCFCVHIYICVLLLLELLVD